MDKLKRFIEKSKKRHNDKYCYDKVIYVSSKEKVEIVCDDHGSFFVRPDAHIRKVGCPKCKGGIKYNNESFIEKCLKLKGNQKYKYDKVEYINSSTKVLIECTIHGPFYIRPANFLNGQGCSKCSGVYRKTKNEFILESNLVHGDLYDYHLIDYKNNRTKVKILCKKHGVFEQIPKEHLNGHGCNICNSSRGENKISNILNILGIKFERNKKFDTCKGSNGGCLPFDFYIEGKNVLIEYDGRQHYEPIEHFGGIETFNKQLVNDEIRNKWCSSNNIKLLRISYKDDVSKIIDYFSSIYSYNFNNYFESYYEVLDYLKTLSNDISINYSDGLLNCDFLLKDKNIAIRLIGFWKNCDKNENKKDNINLKQNFNKIGINLINIFEDTWVNKKEIVKSRLNYKSKNCNIIMARKCTIKHINNEDYRLFLSNNHMQGFIGAKVKIGLFYQDRLISIMSFGSLRRNMGGVSKKGSYELLRFCNLINQTVVGSASKLFNFFIKEYNPESIISYADLSWTDLSKSVYEQIGLKKVHISKPSYYYVDNGVKRNRFLYRKDVLVKSGYDSNKTEFEICDSIGLLRIYDTGTLKFEWVKG